jgi:hypothetical protein
MMQWELKRRLGAGAAMLLLLLISVAIYLHSSQGPDEFRKMDHALRLAQSWRSHRVMNEPDRSNDAHMEVYCPSSVHTWQTSTSYGQPPQESETIDTINGSYMRKGSDWMLAGVSERMISSPCTWGPRGMDDFLGTMDVVLQSGRIHRGDTRRVNGDLCRDWTASVPASTGWRDSFVVCIDEQDLPLEVAAPDRSLVITYSDWNKPILIETPPLAPPNRF